MKSRSAFEERLISYSSESTLKSAKQLLKNNQISGAFRDRNQVLHAVFEEKNNIKTHTHLQLGDKVRGQCDCAAANQGGQSSDNGELCMHAIALWMYAGLFKVPEQNAAFVDTDEANYVGLRNAGLEALAKECTTSAQPAEVVINAESAFPHVPSKWENAVLSVRLRSGKKEYLGNLNNLRQLFFDKVLTVQLKLSDFTLADRQIIRFLAINGEAENSNILLNSELTSELFHMLGDFKNFFRNGRRVIIHNDCAAEAVVLSANGKDAREYSPGIVYRGAALEIHSAKVITGKSGCWVGKNGEYFWLNAGCEVGFMRNFFRLGRWNGNMAGCNEFLRTMPFRQIKTPLHEPQEKPAAVVLNGSLLHDTLTLDLKFVYDKYSFRPDGGRLALDSSSNFFLRQEMMEAEIVNALKMLKSSGDITRGQAILNGSENIGFFLNELLPDWLKRYKSMALGGTLAQLANGGNQLPMLELECQCSGQLNERNCYIFTYRWGDRSGGSTACGNVLQAAQKHERFIVLDNGRWNQLANFEDTVKLGKLMQSLDEAKNCFEIPAVMLHYFRHLTRHYAGVKLPESFLASPVAETTAVPEKRYPFNAKLRNYQQEGAAWLRKMLVNNFNVILADEMGLGKTVQALAAYNELRQLNNAPSLVICPASLVENWSRECGKFLTDCKVGLLYGSSRPTVAKDLNGYDIIITSYSIVRRELAKLSKTVFNLLILDEAQHIKNPGTANAHSCKSLRANHKLVLTGTPLENSPEDLWSIFDFLHPGLLGSFSGFKQEYADIGSDLQLRNDLAARTAPFIKRRVKSSVAPELPPREDVNIFCTMDQLQRKLYDSILEEGRNMLSDMEMQKRKSPKKNMQILTTLLRLRQICCHPQLLNNMESGNGAEVSTQAITDIPSAKFELMQELLMEHIDSGHKVLLFSQFTSLLSIVRSYLDSRQIKYCYLDGATRNRQEVVDEFNNTPDIPIFLLSLKAGGTGLNLTSADTVMIYDPWWNPATELQATDRTHRIGQTRPVRSIKLLVKDSIEEKILALQERKQELFDSMVENPALSMEKLSIEDLKYLFQGD
ncbi:MAG: DEAD/DEAH box helicase [Lentisphaerae bacterium]|nr:DEAD/DEAH box helicase [Lentisphaerota bacterium]